LIVSAYSRSKAVRASFVAWKSEKGKVLYTSGESLVIPAAMQIAWKMCDDAVANKLATVPLSNNTTKWRIQEFAVDVLQ